MKLFIFDVDGTLANRDSSQLLANVAEWRSANPDAKIAFATNQGGVGLREWMLYKGFGDPHQYPSYDEVMARLRTIASALGVPLSAIYVCFAYQTKKGQWAEFPPTKNYNLPQWSASWRKPSPGMLLQAMSDANMSAATTVMVGDSDEDRQAAAAAGVQFIHAKEFFGA